MSIARTNLAVCENIIYTAGLTIQYVNHETLSDEDVQTLLESFARWVDDIPAFHRSLRRTLQKCTYDIETTKEAIATWKNGDSYVRSVFPPLKSMEDHLAMLLQQRSIMTFVADFMTEKLATVRVTASRLRSILTNERITRGERERQPSLM